MQTFVRGAVCLSCSFCCGRARTESLPRARGRWPDGPDEVLFDAGSVKMQETSSVAARQLPHAWGSPQIARRFCGIPPSAVGAAISRPKTRTQANPRVVEDADPYRGNVRRHRTGGYSPPAAYRRAGHCPAVSKTLVQPIDDRPYERMRLRRAAGGVGPCAVNHVLQETAPQTF